MTHEDLWRAIDMMAADNGISVCAMARRAGLHETTFNPSKRYNYRGLPRWPTFDTINKTLDAMNMSMYDFLALVTRAHGE